MSRDEAFMRRALDLAVRARGRTSPNPLVGAVLVRGDRVIGEGYHRRAGRPHAEVAALRAAAAPVRGATMYVNLEPCAHHGRTPPCADALIEAGVGRVVVGMTDPDPRVRGRGIRRLRRAGVAVTTGVLRDVCLRVNEAFVVRVRTGRPFVTLKLAAALDGRIATAGGDARWISSAASRRRVHVLRNQADAVLVGAQTVTADDPRLTCRIRGGRDPLRVVLDGRLGISPSARVCRLAAPPGTLIATSRTAARARGAAYERAGLEVLAFPGRRGRIALRAVLETLAGRGVNHVLIEGGGQTAAAALREHVVDKVLFFYAPLLLGGDGRAMLGALAVGRVADGRKLHTMQLERIGRDVLVSGYLQAH